MAAITSKLLNQVAMNDADIPNLNDQSQASNTNSYNILIDEEFDLTADQILPDAAIIAEIEALQEAIAKNPDFDFSQLEATAAGTNNDSSKAILAEDSIANPLLIENTPLNITYRSEQTVQTNNEQSVTSDSSAERPDSFSEIPVTPLSSSQINSQLVEDFVTHRQGQFSPNQRVSEQAIRTEWGEFSTDGAGNWQYTLNNDSAALQALSAGTSVQDSIKINATSGQQITINFDIQGANDQAIIQGNKVSSVAAESLDSINNSLPSVTGKLTVSDIDSGESRFHTQYDIQGNFGNAQVNALGEWTYTLNNHDDVILSLREGETLLDTFSVKTLDGTKQLIQISIEGANDKPLLTGNNVVELDLSIAKLTTGKLSIIDPDFGESSFISQSGIQSKYGYGSAEIDMQGNWRFELDGVFFERNPLGEGQTKIESFTVFTSDGTSQEIHIPLKGSDTPFYVHAQNQDSSNLSIESMLITQEHNDLHFLDQPSLAQAANDSNNFATHIETELTMSNDASMQNLQSIDLPLG